MRTTIILNFTNATVSFVRTNGEIVNHRNFKNQSMARLLELCRKLHKANYRMLCTYRKDDTGSDILDYVAFMKGL